MQVDNSDVVRWYKITDTNVILIVDKPVYCLTLSRTLYDTINEENVSVRAIHRDALDVANSYEAWNLIKNGEELQYIVDGRGGNISTFITGYTVSDMDSKLPTMQIYSSELEDLFGAGTLQELPFDKAFIIYTPQIVDMTGFKALFE